MGMLFAQFIKLSRKFELFLHYRAASTFVSHPRPQHASLAIAAPKTDTQPYPAG
jgi:hypothetical protein